MCRRSLHRSRTLRRLRCDFFSPVLSHISLTLLSFLSDGPLYNLTRKDGQNLDVKVATAGGYADKAAHDAFCKGTDCFIYNVYDQSPEKNHLGPRHKVVNASRHPITAGGKDVYGMWFDPGFGYHVDNTTGVAQGNDPESIYAVMSGTHFNGGCCFDYGNSESDDHDDGCGTMEAIYFGNAHWHGNSGALTPGAKTQGPWAGVSPLRNPPLLVKIWVHF